LQLDENSNRFFIWAVTLEKIRRGREFPAAAVLG
jgi:hypothetical protein